MDENTPLLQVSHLKKYYPIKKGVLRRTVGQIKAVDDVSFDVQRGETLGLVGESGCGKTTLSRAILQLQRPTSGAVYLNGLDLVKLDSQALRKLRPRMQIIFQNPYSSLNPRSTVSWMLIEPMIVHGIARGQQARARAEQLLELVGLSPVYIERFPSEFSGGQRQRIGIARALSVNPEFIICDEPISSLDVSIQAQIVNLLRRLQKDLGLTYLFISHDLSMVRYISDRIAVMYLGKIVELADSQDLAGEPLHPYTQALWSVALVADPEVEETKQRIVLQGEVPSPANPPPGCRFSTRCPHVMDVCRQIEPEFREIQPHHWAACHLY